MVKPIQNFKDYGMIFILTEALMMTIRLNGKLGEKTERTVHLAAAMIREIIRSMFPSVADSVAVCASQQTEACSKVDIGRPKLTVKGKNNIFNI